MQELNHVIAQTADPANFKDILTVIYIAFDCDCTTPCGYVHIDRFADQNAICEAHARAGLQAVEMRGRGVTLQWQAVVFTMGVLREGSKQALSNCFNVLKYMYIDLGNNSEDS